MSGKVSSARGRAHTHRNTTLDGIPGESEDAAGPPLPRSRRTASRAGSPLGRACLGEPLSEALTLACVDQMLLLYKCDLLFR